MRIGLAHRAICLATCLAAVVLLAACAAVARGGSGTIITMPLGPKPTVKGLRMAVDCRWVHGYGYRPIRVNVACTPPAKTDRSLAIEIGIADWAPDEQWVTVAAHIDIPAGSTGVSKLVSVPQLNAAQYLSVKVWEDGMLLEGLSVANHSIGSGGFWGGSTSGPRILFVGSTPVDVSRFDTVTQNPSQPQGSRTADVTTFDSRSPAQLEEEWINYSGLDLVFLSLSDARDLAANRPGVWQALRAWTRSGGNLCVFGAGGNWQGLEEIEQLLGCPATDKEAAGKLRGWESPSADVFSNQVVPAMLTARDSGAVDPNTGQPIVSTTLVPQTPPAAGFVWKPAALGRVAAIADAQPFPGEGALWRWLLESLGTERTTWTMRHGTAPDQDNPNFNDFLIADVGLPPIRTYRVLITLFVVFIGPVNYWILRRHGRLHLFLFTVPLAALITSGALLGYALVADGLASRMRARSLTHLDQRTGEAARIARLSYYAGLAPSGGLEFPSDAAIVPLELNASAGPFNGRDRRLVWGERQYLTRGWLRSRMPTQYVTVRSDKSRRTLAVVPSGDARLTIENRLGVAVKQLVWCDEAGKLHHGKRIAADERQTLAALETEVQLAAALEDFDKEYSQHVPALPDTMLGVNSPSSWFFGSRRYNWYAAESFVETSQSLLEVELERIRSDVASRHLAPRSFVAIVERPEEIAVGMDGLNESQSLHVIYGTW